MKLATIAALAKALGSGSSGGGGGGGGGGSGLFVVHEVVDEQTDSAVLDKKWSEINSAYSNGQTVVLREEGEDTTGTYFIDSPLVFIQEGKDSNAKSGNTKSSFPPKWGAGFVKCVYFSGELAQIGCVTFFTEDSADGYPSDS